MLMQSAKNGAHLEATMDKTVDRMQKMQLLEVQWQCEVDTVCEAAETLDTILEQVRAMER